MEVYKALKTALYSGGNSICSVGVLSAANYMVPTATGANYGTDGGYFVIGQDLETYSGKSGLKRMGSSTCSI